MSALASLTITSWAKTILLAKHDSYGKSGNGKSVLELRRQLGLDSGYVSHLLCSLEKQGLIVEKTTKNDRRIRFVSLTKAGFREQADLGRRANAFAESLLNPLSNDQREKLVAAMAEVERLLVASPTLSKVKSE